MSATSTSLTLATVSPSTYRDAISHHAAGVAIVTTAVADEPVGLTVSSVASHSVEPPTLSCDLALTTRTLPALRAQGRFAIHLLAEDQAGLASRFARSGVDRFADTAWQWWEGLPTPEGALANFACEHLADMEVGDHAVVLGTVTAVAVDEQQRPLVHQGRGFHRLG